jgi:hypothetical protein
MKATYLNIGLDTSLNVYDPTKTSLMGDVVARTINSKTCYSPTPPILVDTFTDVGSYVGIISRYTANNRLFVCNAISAGVATIVLYSFDSVTGVKSYVGKIVATFPNLAATTHTIRGFKVVDTGTTGWKILISTTGSVAVNGGVFLINKVDLADFGPVSYYTFPMATALASGGGSTSDGKAVYFLADPAALGASNAQTANCGLVRDAINNHLYSHNGISATHQYYKYDLAVAPTINGGVQTFTMSIATPAVFTANSHGYNNNDQVTLYTTGALPTGFTAGTSYFIRNATTNTFELSLTTGGASIASSGSQSGTHSVLRSYGISSNTFLLKTGNLPALTGTLLQTNAEDYANPDHGGVAIEGFPCVALMTQTQFYIGRLSELTSGTTTWASLTTCNLLGTPTQITAPVALFGNWDQVLQMFVYVTSLSIFVAKKIINGQIIAVFGGVDNTYLESTTPFAPALGNSTLAAFDMHQGWVFTLGSTVGQRVICGAFLKSDAYFEYSEMYTPIIPNGEATANFGTTIEELYDITTTTSLAFRTGAIADAQWATKDAGTWTEVQAAQVINIPPTEAIQIRVRWDMMTLLSSTPAQIVDLAVGYTPIDEMSDQWVGSLENSSAEGASPFYIAFRLQAAYLTGVVPQFRIDLVDDSNNIVQTFDSIADSSSIEKSTNNGTSWGAMGTIPNTPLTTEIRVLVSSPPSGRLRARLIEV